MTTSLTTKPKTSLASQFLDIFEFSETTKTLEVFIEKSILIILNSRLNSQKTSSSNKLNSSFNIPENEIPEISDFFFDEYNDLFEPSPKTTNNYIIELEYRKGKHKFLIEKYEIQYSFIAENVHNNSKLTQQLTSILRMIHSLTRSLPAREFTQFKHDKNKSINYRIFSCQKHMNDFIYGEKVHKIKLDTEDICSNIKVNVNVEYLSKESLVRIENDYSKRKLSDLSNNRNQRQRCLSLNTPYNNSNSINDNNYCEIVNYSLNETIIKDNYFTCNHNNTTNVEILNENNISKINKPLNQIDTSFQSECNSIERDLMVFKKDKCLSDRHTITSYNRSNASSSLKKLVTTNDTTSDFSNSNINDNDSFELCLESDDECLKNSNNHNNSTIKSECSDNTGISSIQNNKILNNAYLRYVDLKKAMTQYNNKYCSKNINMQSLAVLTLNKDK